MSKTTKIILVLLVLGAAIAAGVVFMKQKASPENSVIGLGLTTSDLLRNVGSQKDAVKNRIGGMNIQLGNSLLTWRDSVGYVTGVAFQMDGSSKEDYQVGAKALQQILRNVVGTTNAVTVQNDIATKMSNGGGEHVWHNDTVTVKSLTDPTSGSLMIFFTKTKTTLAP